MKRVGMLIVLLFAVSLAAFGQDSMSPAAEDAWDKGFELTKKGDYPAALAEYEKGIAISPKAAEIWSEYAVCLRKVNRIASSLKAGWQAILLAPHVWEPWNGQANTFIANGNLDLALECLDKAEPLGRDRAFVARQYLALAYELWEGGRTGDALKAVEKARSIDESNGLCYVDQGAMLYHGDKAKKKEAKALVEKGIKLLKKDDRYNTLQYAYGIMEKIKDDEPWTPERWQAATSRQEIPGELMKQPSEATLAIVAIPPSVRRSYDLPEGDSWCIVTPEPWWETVGESKSLFLFTCEFKPLDFQKYLVMISPRYQEDDDQEVRREAELKLEVARANATEKEIPIQAFSGPTSSGFYFIVSDKKYDPKKVGDYPLMLSAAVESGKLRFHITVLFMEKEENFVTAITDMLKSIQYLPKGA